MGKYVSSASRLECREFGHQPGLTNYLEVMNSALGTHDSEVGNTTDSFVSGLIEQLYW